MAKDFVLNVAECNVVDKLTTNAQMDWLFIDETGRCRDRDRNNRVMSARTAIKTLIEGLVENDYSNLTHNEYIVFINLAGKLM